MSHVSRRLAVLASAIVVAALGLATPAAAGTATRTEVPSHFGVKPLHPGTVAQGARPSAVAKSGTLAVASSGSRGVVSRHPSVYLVFWGSQWSNDPAGVAPDLQNMFNGLFGASDTWTPIMDQYCEGVAAGTTTCGTSGLHIRHPKVSPLKGVWFDNAKAEPAHATGNQIAAEAKRAAVHFGNLTQRPNLNAQYVIVSATGTHPDNYDGPNGFCGWHDFTMSAHGKLAYTNLPYLPDLGAGACTTLGPGRLLDGIESTETHEYAEVLTDFWPSRGWNGALGEIGDACADLDRHLVLTTGTFDVQGLWSNSANGCVTAA